MTNVTSPAPPSSHGRTFFRAFALFALRATFAVAATIVLAQLADANHWCCVHGWALAHGTGLVVLLFFGLVGFHIVSFAGVRTGLLAPHARYGWLPHLAYVATALGTQFLYGDYFMWLGLFASVVGVICRLRGRVVQPFGLIVVGLAVSVLSVTYWGYGQWTFMHYGMLPGSVNAA
jgi:hypothetical protein